MAINNLVQKLAAAALLAGAMAGCRATVDRTVSGNIDGGGEGLVRRENGGSPTRAPGESDSAYHARMAQLSAQQSGMTWTAGGYVPQEDASFYSGMSQRDATRYGGHQAPK